MDDIQDHTLGSMVREGGSKAEPGEENEIGLTFGEMLKNGGGCVRSTEKEDL